MENILDADRQPPKKKGRFFSFASLVFAIITLVLALMVAFSFDSVKVAENQLLTLYIVSRALNIVGLLGMACTVVSFVRKEPPSTAKCVGAVLNCLFLLLVTALIVFSRLRNGM